MTPVEAEKKEADKENKVENPNSKKEIVFDSSGYLTKRKLSMSIKEVNQRVKFSRAGKRSIAKYISETYSSPISKGMISLNRSTNNMNSKSKCKDFFEEKPQPYVPLTNGKIEDPLVLPKFQEFLVAGGDDYIFRKGKDEIFYRIDRANDQINKLKDMLDQKTNKSSELEKKTQIRRSSKMPKKKINS